MQFQVIENHALIGHHTLVVLLSHDDRYTVQTMAVTPTEGEELTDLIERSLDDRRYHEPWSKSDFAGAVTDFAKQVTMELFDEVQALRAIEA